MENVQKVKSTHTHITYNTLTTSENAKIVRRKLLFAKCNIFERECCCCWCASLSLSAVMSSNMAHIYASQCFMYVHVHGADMNIRYSFRFSYLRFIALTVRTCEKNAWNTEMFYSSPSQQHHTVFYTKSNAKSMQMINGKVKELFNNFM